MQTVLYLLFWAGLFFVIMRFGCGSHIMGHGHHSEHNHGDGIAGEPPAEAQDPVCGMKVKTGTAKTSLWQGKAYYFCSQTCRDKFEASSQSWAGQPAADHREHPSQQEGMGHGAA
jgi:YHS domain-containing protein